MASEWNSLEVAKLAVGAATPLFIFGLGWMVNRAAKRLEDVQWASRTIIEKRLEVYGELAPLLNDLYVFFMLVGHFAHISPPAALARKRACDRIFFVHAPLFGEPFRRAYERFIDSCFLHFTRVGQPAQLKSRAALQRDERGGKWDDSWDAMFVPDDASPRDQIHALYWELMETFAQEVGRMKPPAAKVG